MYGVINDLETQLPLIDVIVRNFLSCRILFIAAELQFVKRLAGFVYFLELIPISVSHTHNGIVSSSDFQEAL